ncbi:YigZ family protein [Streptomyces sp. HB2AG]|uniref:YigZ family protein n=1 Tax=Streptomyces sp. HB2AG TaxID=2983400 RepID=UPI0022AA31CF|nr:YigZ family protein [Streptomyces sp. HB2AG]MCZ2524067.1 YigZ family protein [Streptomyces sp. HB2AG]
MPQRYTTVARRGTHETEVKGSRFICTLAPADSERAAQEFVREIRALHPNATHNCAAYVIGADGRIQRSDDDGEPGGTAGTPMLQMLMRRGVRDVAAVVTRYFGGTLLGAGGLVRAYGGAVGKALDAVGTVTRERMLLAEVEVDHQRAGRLENDLRASGRPVRAVHYGARGVRIEVGLPSAEAGAFGTWLADTTAGAATLRMAGTEYTAT